MYSKRVFLFMAALLIACSALGATWASGLAREAREWSTFTLTLEQPEDVFLGKGGVFMVSSSYNGYAVISRWEPYGLKHPGLKFVDRWIEFRIYGQDTEEFEILYGFNYVYFNLTNAQRQLWNSDDLRIYHYDESTAKWVECPTYLVANENSPNGRLTCVMTEFGFYGLAMEK